MEVAVTTPTMGRAERHEDLYRVFSRQTWAKKRLHVLDESAEPSRFFGGLRDPRVDYVHAPGARGEVTRIGDARNRLLRRTTAELVAHFDDDDDYAPDYLEKMVGRLGSADLVKLSVWRALVEADGTIWQWDTRTLGGKHWVIQGGAPAVETHVPPGGDPMTADWTMWGFGFSYVYRRKLWEAGAFPEEGTEDYPWVAEHRRAGRPMVLVPDGADWCLHTVHPKSASVICPQKRLAAPRGWIREDARLRALGAAESMVRLPTGRDIVVQPGATYLVVAEVKESNGLKDISARAASWGVTVLQARDRVDPSEYGLPKPKPGYRLIEVMARASRGGVCPWRVPPPFTVVNASSMVLAWTDTPPMRAPIVPHELGLHRVGVGALGAGGSQQQMLSLFQQTAQSYILNSELNPVADEQAIERLIRDLASGNWGAVAQDAASIGTTMLTSAIGGPVGLVIGAFFAGIEAIEFAYGGGVTACQVPGCNFGLPDCPWGLDNGNPFTWTAIGASPYIQGTGILDWGSDYFTPSATSGGGPGSFEAALSSAIIAQWNAEAAAPAICALLAGTDGNIGVGGDATRNGVWKVLIAKAGAVIPPFVYAWNKSHTTGTMTTGSAGWCPPGMTYQPGNQGSNGSCVGPAPPRTISYPVRSLSNADPSNFTDPIEVAMMGLAAMAGLPAGSTIAIVVNGGPAHLVGPVQRSGGYPTTPEGGGLSTLETVGLVAGGAVAVTTVGTAIYAWRTRQKFGDVVKKALAWRPHLRRRR